MNGNALTSLDENTRRYYLDTMGIQCWQLLDEKQGSFQADQQQVEQQVYQQQAEHPQERQSHDEQSTTGSRDVAAVDWAQLETAVARCELCLLHKTRHQAAAGTAGTGIKTSSLMFVLLSPNDDDALLSAQAKSLFKKMLAAIDISIDEVYLTSLLKCRVPENHTVSAGEVSTCKQYLKRQIQLVRPKQLVVLGDTAVRCLLQKNMSLDDFREHNNMSPRTIEDAVLFVSYSPEELLLQPENKRKAWTDLQQLQKLLGG